MWVLSAATIVAGAPEQLARPVLQAEGLWGAPVLAEDEGREDDDPVQLCAGASLSCLMFLSWSLAEIECSARSVFPTFGSLRDDEMPSKEAW